MTSHSSTTNPGSDIGEQSSDPAPSSSLSGSESDSQCKCSCCKDFTSPHQPAILRKVDTTSRSIQTTWYKKYPWTSVCTNSYCNICSSAKQKGLVSFPKHPQIPFVEGGFSNWKKALQRFDSHEKSANHREAISRSPVCLGV